MHTNEFVLDGRVQSEPIYQDGVYVFTISVCTGKDTVEREDGVLIEKPRFTYIRCVYKQSDFDDKGIKVGSLYRFGGKLDSDKYITKTGKAVFNKILEVFDAIPLKFDKEIGEYVEVE